MAAIDASPEFREMLLDRISTEHGHTVVANFALGLQQNILVQKCLNLEVQLKVATDRAVDLQSRYDQALRDNDELKATIDPKRGNRFRRARETQATPIVEVAPQADAKSEEAA